VLIPDDVHIDRMRWNNEAAFIADSTVDVRFCITIARQNTAKIGKNGPHHQRSAVL